MIGRAELQVSLQQFEQFNPEQACEDFITITNSTLRNAMQLHNMIHEHLGNRSYQVWVLNRNKMTVFGKSVNHHKYSRKSIGQWHSLNEIHRNVSLGMQRCGQGLEQSRVLTQLMFGLLTDGTLLNKVLNILLHAMPIEHLLKPLISSLNA
jgi:hypothetical protein